MNHSLDQKVLVPVEADEANVRPFGRLVGVPGDGLGSRGTQFYGATVDLWNVPEFESDADTCLSIARVRPRPAEVIWMERHFKHTQVFLPLRGEPFVVVLAPPTRQSLPSAESIQAFVIPAGLGLLLQIGTWHEFPFPLHESLDIAVVLRNETNRDLEAIEDGEAIGGDLEKRNVRRRLATSFMVDGLGQPRRL